MDRKIIFIAVLTITAGLLAGVLVDGLRPPAAQAQGGRYADYAMVPAATSSNSQSLCVVDTLTERMLFFSYDQSKKTLEVIGKAELRKDFGDR